MDKVVIDIETKNCFADVGGEQNIHLLDASFAGIYSYRKNQYISFFENEIENLEEYLKEASPIIGFAINHFDLPVLSKYLKFDLLKIPRLDLSEEIELSVGKRIGLNSLAKTNLGTNKTHDSLEAITLYSSGDLKELQSYCLNDVKITKELYELAKKQGFLMYQDKKTGETVRVKLNTQDWI